jgi:hypothetical protein
MKYILSVNNANKAAFNSLEDAKNEANKFITEKEKLEISSGILLHDQNYIEGSLLAKSETWTYDYKTETWKS